MKNNYKVGDRVLVIQNSERVASSAHLGETGVVTQNVAGDCLVRFDDDGSLGYIWQKDLQFE